VRTGELNRVVAPFKRLEPAAFAFFVYEVKGFAFECA
jgi:hypothetical protein